VSRSIADSIGTVLSGSMAPDEEHIVGRIEAIRAQMDASPRMIVCTDFGAGDGTEARSPAEMRAGVEVRSTLGEISRNSSKSPVGARLLFRLIRAVKPASCVEMGTCVGISAAYQAAALKLNGQGQLVTLEGAAELAAIAKENLELLGFEQVEVMVGRFEHTLPAALQRLSPVDYVFVDGHHDHAATLAYFEQVLVALSETAVVVFDDISWSAGMEEAWQLISRHPRVSLALDMGALGVCVMDPSIEDRNYFRIPLE